MFKFTFISFIAVYFVHIELYLFCFLGSNNSNIYILGQMRYTMFNFFRKKHDAKFEKEIKESFSDVKKDMKSVGKWIKHLDEKDKQLFDMFYSLRNDISMISDEIESLKEALDFMNKTAEDKQLFEKMPVLNKQTAVEDVQIPVQTTVQTDNFYNFIRNLSGNERMIIFALLNNEMKLSYEDIALLLGKDKSTIRGQINSIKQKSEGLVEEIVEKTGKKRVYIPEEIKEKLAKYAKVRVRKEKKTKKEA